MKGGVTQKNRSTVRPVNFPFHQPSPDRVGQCIEAKTSECIAQAFFSAKNVVVRLVLPFAPSTQRRLEVSAQKPHRIELIGFAPHSHPNKVNVVGHKTVGWEEKLFPRSDVGHQFAKSSMKVRR